MADYGDCARFNLITGAFLGYTGIGILPRGLAVQPGTGNLYITSRFNHVLTIFFANGSLSSTLSNANFVAPYSVAFSANGTLYVGDELAGAYGIGALIAFTPATGQTLFVVDDTDDGFALDFVTGLAVDNVGNVYVVDQGVGRVVVINATGAVLGSFYGTGAGNTASSSVFTDGFVFPYSVAVDSQSYYIYVSDGAAGNVVQLAGLMAAPTTVGATLGDPQFYGSLGQSYQVHGIDGEAYSLISDALVQINGRFHFLGESAEDDRRADIEVYLPHRMILDNVTVSHPSTKTWRNKVARSDVHVVGDTRAAEKVSAYQADRTAW